MLTIPLLVKSQASCATAQIVEVDSLKTMTKFTADLVYFKIRKDSLNREITFSGSYKRLTVQPEECIDAKSWLLDSSGQIIPSAEMINSGVCFCQSCIKRYSSFKLSNDLYLKVEGGSSLNFEMKKTSKKKELAWYEKKLKSGDKIRLNKILFVGGLAKFRTISYKDLNRLFKVLEDNPLVDVEIQGHVNSPGKRNNKVNQELSYNRAKAVMDFLIKKGIRPERLSAVGYGNTKMIYPKAKTELEMQFNRRVEVLVK